jgi:hypothetical protein
MHVAQSGIFAARDELALLSGVRSAQAGRPGRVGTGNCHSAGTLHDDWSRHLPGELWPSSTLSMGAMEESGGEPGGPLSKPGARSRTS